MNKKISFNIPLGRKPRHIRRSGFIWRFGFEIAGHFEKVFRMVHLCGNFRIFGVFRDVKGTMTQDPSSEKTFRFFQGSQKYDPYNPCCVNSYPRWPKFVTVTTSLHIRKSWEWARRMGHINSWPWRDFSFESPGCLTIWYIYIYTYMVCIYNIEYV